MGAHFADMALYVFSGRRLSRTMLQASKDGVPLLPSHFLTGKSSDVDLTRRVMDDSAGESGHHQTHPTAKKKLVVKDIVFKSYVIVSMTFVWSAYALTLRYTRTRSDRPMYLSTTVVFLAELTKFWMAAFLLFKTHRYSVASAKQELRTDFIGKPIELLKMSVPSIAYAIQNNLDFVALSNLDPGVYQVWTLLSGDVSHALWLVLFQVTCQLKVVTTAVFMVLMLGRRYSLTRWLAIVLLFGGVALVQLDALSASETAAAASTISKAKNGTAAVVHQLPQQNYFKGISAVLATCLTAGFAGKHGNRGQMAGTVHPE